METSGVDNPNIGSISYSVVISPHPRKINYGNEMIIFTNHRDIRGTSSMETHITFIWISSIHFCFSDEDVGESNLVVPRANDF